jgi:hypothetical protein
MKAPSMGNVYLLGPDSDIWETPNHLDLFSINPKKSDNSLSKLITVVVVDWFHRLVSWRLRVSTIRHTPISPHDSIVPKQLTW